MARTNRYVYVAELVDALPWGGSEHYARAGSTPVVDTN